MSAPPPPASSERHPGRIPDQAQFINGFATSGAASAATGAARPASAAQAVEAFFTAGGRRAYVVRVLPADATAGRSEPVPARADDAWGIRRDVLQLDAKGNGAWAEHLRVHIEPSTAFQDVAFRVRVEWTEAGRSRTVETFDNVRMDPEHEDYAVRVINETSQYLRATDLFEAFLDLEERTGPPLPERRCSASSSSATSTASRSAGRSSSPGATSPPGRAPTPRSRPRSSSRRRRSRRPPARSTAPRPSSPGAARGAAGGGARRSSSGSRRRRARRRSGEPAAASRAYLEFRLADDQDAFDLAAVDTVRVTAANGTGGDQEQYDVDVTDVGADGLGRPAALAERIAAVIEAADDDPYGIEVGAAGRFVVLTTQPSTEGAALTIETVGGDEPWSDPVTAGGSGGLEVAAQQGVELHRVSEVLQLGVGRFLSQVFPVRASGLSENHQGTDLRPQETGDTPLRLLGGGDGSGLVGATQYRGEVTDLGRTGLHAFDTVDVNMLVLPGKNTATSSRSPWPTATSDMFLVADGVGSVDPDFEISADEVRRVVEGLPARSNNAAMFYPWIKVPDPVGASAAARAGSSRCRATSPGCSPAPTCAARRMEGAGRDRGRGQRGAVDLQQQPVDADQDLLNPIGLNCIRQFPNVGIVSWGARTLSSDPEWRYVPVRRMALFLKASLRQACRAVFEPNDQQLWDRIRINITAFMLGLFRQGASRAQRPTRRSESSATGRPTCRS